MSTTHKKILSALHLLVTSYQQEVFWGSKSYKELLKEWFNDPQQKADVEAQIEAWDRLVWYRKLWAWLFTDIRLKRCLLAFSKIMSFEGSLKDLLPLLQAWARKEIRWRKVRLLPQRVSGKLCWTFKGALESVIFTVESLPSLQTYEVTTLREREGAASPPSLLLSRADGEEEDNIESQNHFKEKLFEIPPKLHTHFQEMGIQETKVSLARLTKAYRQKALHLHPDRAGDSTTEAFQNLANLYQTLSQWIEDQVRQEYEKSRRSDLIDAKTFWEAAYDEIRRCRAEEAQRAQQQQREAERALVKEKEEEWKAALKERWGCRDSESIRLYRDRPINVEVLGKIHLIPMTGWTTNPNEGFALLGASREEVSTYLLTLLSEEESRKILAHDLREALEKGELTVEVARSLDMNINYVEEILNKIKFLSSWKLNWEDVYWSRAEFQSWVFTPQSQKDPIDNFELAFIAWLLNSNFQDEATKLTGLREERALAEQALQNYCKKEDTLRAYVLGLSRHFRLGPHAAGLYAQAHQISLVIWGERALDRPPKVNVQKENTKIVYGLYSDHYLGFVPLVKEWEGEEEMPIVAPINCSGR